MAASHTQHDAPRQRPEPAPSANPSDQPQVQSLVDKAVGPGEDPRPGSMVTGADVPGGGAWNPLDLDTPLGTEDEDDLGDDVLDDEETDED